ncbi:MAG: peptidylprolyl isomerase [Candidatus Cryptobacteroides sp.]|nr:peptidylprolyl isomerase [Candidatus Cryptobacteroides sp.]
MKWMYRIALAAVLTVMVCNSCKNVKNKNAGQQIDSTALMLKLEPEFDIETTEGTFRVKLYSKTPKHRDNFCKLVAEHYYDSLLFHRVINGFMIQTGDPLTRDTANVEKYGTGGPDYTIPAEFVNEYYHKKGALAAARRGDTANPRKSSSGSQFYIVQDEMGCIHLDGEYTVFGETVEGLDVIDRIAGAPTDKYERPLKDIRILSIRPVVREIEPEGDAADSTAVKAPAGTEGEADEAGKDMPDMPEVQERGETAGTEKGEIQVEEALEVVGKGDF